MGAGGVRPGDVRWALAAPVLAYPLAVVVLRAPPFDPVAALVTVALAIPFLDIAPARLGGLGYVPAAVAWGWLAILAAVDSAGADPAIDAALVGLLLGGPLLLLALTARTRASLPLAPLATVATLAVGLLELAVVAALPAGPTTPAAWAGAARSVVGGQAAALGAVVANAPVPAVPLAAAADFEFDGLALLALAGLLASWAIEATGPSEPTGRPESRPFEAGPAGAPRFAGRALGVAAVAVLGVEVGAAISATLVFVAVPLGVAATLALLAWGPRRPAARRDGDD